MDKKVITPSVSTANNLPNCINESEKGYGDISTALGYHTF